MDEKIAENPQGYYRDGPVRIGNVAAGQVQHDTYGSIILAAMPMFFDRRLPRPGDAGLFHLLERLDVVAERSAFEPDAGIWEYQGRMSMHMHSVAMCWAGRNRLAAIAQHLGMKVRAAYWSNVASDIQARLLEEAWSEKRGAFTAAPGVEELDASVLLLPDIGLIEAGDPQTNQLCGNFPQTYCDGRTDTHGNAPVAELGGRVCRPRLGSGYRAAVSGRGRYRPRSQGSPEFSDHLGLDDGTFAGCARRWEYPGSSVTSMGRLGNVGRDIAFTTTPI
jgi:hypothetical protein